MADPIKIKNVTYDGRVGEFRGNGEVIGWKGTDGAEDMVIHPVENVTQAAWFEGELRIGLDGDDIMQLKGFKPQDFETLWQHFAAFEVHIKKVTRTTQLTEGAFDDAIQRLSRHADLVDDAKSGTVQKKSKEFDLLKCVEAMRNGLEEAVKGDKNALNRVFAANNCERIGKLRLVINTVQLEVYDTDHRWVHLRNMAATIQSVLRELGTFVRWRPPEADSDDTSDAMAKRQMMWELKCKQNPELNPDSFLHEVEIIEAPKVTKPAVNPLAATQPANPNPLLDALSKAQAKFEAGDFVEGRYLDGHWYDARIKAANTDGTYELEWADRSPYDTTKRAYDLRKKAGGGYQPVLPPPPEPVPATEEADSDEAEVAPVVVVEDTEEKQTDRPDLVPVTPANERATGEDARMYYIRPDSILEGWVWKRSRVLKYWRRRWLVLTRNGLETLKQRSPGMKPTETIQMGDFQRVYNADGEVSMARCFCIVSRSFMARNFYMVCDDERQKTEWLQKISETLSNRR